MEKQVSNSLSILKLIGWLFSIISFALFGATLWMAITSLRENHDSEFTGFMISAAILTASTSTIAAFIWWIITNKKRFLNYE